MQLVHTLCKENMKWLVGWTKLILFMHEGSEKYLHKGLKKDYAYWPQGVFLKPFCIACGFLTFQQYFSTFKSERSLFKIIVSKKTRDGWPDQRGQIVPLHYYLTTQPTSLTKLFIFLNDAQFLTARRYSNTQSLVISFKYS